MELQQSFLSVFLKPEELCVLKDTVADLSKKYPDVTGVLITGSLAQKISLAPCYTIEHSTPLLEAYLKILNRSGRHIFPRVSSDLDVWVCTSEPSQNQTIKEKVEERAIDLINWLVKNPDLHGTHAWIEQKHHAFDEFYKRPELYTPSWQQVNGQGPWLAQTFTAELTHRIIQSMPDFQKRVNHYFDRNIPGEFIELRAYPPCTFNLRPEVLNIDCKNDKTPFPFIIEEWLDLDRNCFVLYSDKNTSNQIYPFNPLGVKLGSSLATYLHAGSHIS